jgi:hypothetical protein
MTPECKISTGEARTTTLAIADSPALSEFLQEFAESSDPSKLKIAEYALLISPITQGVKDYLKNSKLTGEREVLDPNDLVTRVGLSIADAVLGRLNEDPHAELIDDIARRRSELVSYGNLVYPIENTIEGAALFSTSSLMRSAITNAFVVDQSSPIGNRSRPEFIDAVKNSQQPALSRLVMHAIWNKAIVKESGDYLDSLMDGTDSLNKGAVIYDLKNHKAVPGYRLQRWRVSPDMAPEYPEYSELTASEDGPRIEDIPTPDVRIGCPFSFDLELAKEYYHHSVDSLEYYYAWPDTVADLPGLRQALTIQLLSAGVPLL